MSSLNNATSLLTKLQGLADAGNVEEGKAMLTQLKIAMLDFPTPAGEAYTKVATEALELGVLLTVSEGDLDAFARSMAQLKPYYGGGVATSRKCHILGLNLMHLLVDNRLSEFHSELELLTEQEASNIFVSFPINLERQLMVGIYDEVLNAGRNVPDPSYQFFVDNLLQTVRDSIADCVEVSYKTMTMADAMTMMKFDTPQALREYVQECRDDWIVEGDTLCFQPPPMGSKASDIPSMKLISQSLSYATEMERIV
jgi:26S proteasome regulatory subunit N12